MKKFSIELNEKLDRLVDLYLTDGLSPADFADNIFSSEYKEISVKKNDDQIVLEMQFESEYKDEIIKTKLRYYYDQNKKLMWAEEKINNRRYQKIWDRKDNEEELALEIAQLITEEADKKSRDYFIESLPEELRQRVSVALSKVA